jgi:hypothetical protein
VQLAPNASLSLSVEMDGDGLLSATANPTGDGEGSAKRAEIAAKVAAAKAQRSNAPSSEEAAQYLPAPTPGVVVGQGRLATRNVWPDWQTACAPVYDSVSNVGNQDSPSTKQALFDQVAQQGNTIATNAAAGMEAMQSGLSYESLTEGFMTEGETVTAFMIDYTSIDTWEYGREGDTKKTLPAGKALVTSQRLLLLSCQPTHQTNINAIGTPQWGSQQGRLELSYKAANSVSYRPVPLVNFRSVSMMIEASTTGTATVNKQSWNLNRCCGFQWCLLGCGGCLDDCCNNSWSGYNFATSTNDRYIELDYEGPWGEDSKLVMRLNLHSTTPIEAVQAWACALQAACPKLMRPGDVSVVMRHSNAPTETMER